MFSERELSFFAPPYFELLPATALVQRERPPRGVFLLWDLKHTNDFAATAERVLRRPHGMALIIVLPPPHALDRIRDGGSSRRTRDAAGAAGCAAAGAAAPTS